ncbi:DUF5681 domain-containing protein [Sphingosinicella sp. BN140058]|uniref:DUF5681 domain-containing protein n=1 Tax=Sphingosinicella sp. BN140058 TaxID=1892855 RepID=UPI0010116A34|nr:DUF5681 domain-containing protein [Sphingosinicella sp. BN140058]QAY75622.1 hypothetical protein ETR14_03075 [Sphingosinicella sp. BN140058]
MPDPAAASARAATGRFLPGRSGNPAGRPRGARNKASRLIELLDDGEEAAIARAVIDRALAGEWPALRACFTRLMPPARSAPIEIDLPATATPADVAEAGSAVIAAMAAGEITLREAEQAMKVLVAHSRLIDACDHAAPAARGAVEDGGCGSAATAVARASSAAPTAPMAPVVTMSEQECLIDTCPARPVPQSPAPAPAPEPGPAPACIPPVLTATNAPISEQGFYGDAIPARPVPGVPAPAPSPAPDPAPACISPVITAANPPSAKSRSICHPGKGFPPPAAPAQRRSLLGKAAAHPRATLLASAAFDQACTIRHAARLADGRLSVPPPPADRAHCWSHHRATAPSFS